MMKTCWKSKMCALIALTAMSIGCGDGTEPLVGSTSQADQVTVTEPNTLSRDGDVVDSIEMEGFDSNGQRVFGPVVVPFSTEMVFPAPPASVQTLELDYLRNGGFSLFRATIPRDANGGFDLTDPAEQEIALNDSGFQVLDDGNGGFKLQATVSGAPTGPVRSGVLAQESAATDFRIKGVAYSPAPINYRNLDGPSIGDLFWDSTANARNWFLLWGKGPAPYDFNQKGRDDLSQIRALGCNTIRVYAMISRQLFTIENGQFIPGAVPSPPDKFDHFTHQKFLDACW
ncbi:MAG: hypothetical protein KC800_24015, partial [Candidatus Eremiobacteraeota bacterium]|nr:hypothetical protein [Candidatus Eremiobacteraeota bacterium]